MATRRKKSQLSTKARELIFSSNVFPFILTFALLGILFVLFRMKGIEIDYKISAINKDIEKVHLETKELKAKKAKLMSVKRLRGMADKYGLQRPKQKQIIVIPK